MSNLLNAPMNNPITEDDIAHYLSITPDFFQRHAELLAAVQFTSPHSNRAVSLQERQAEMLREKIKLLEQRLMEMIRNGNENVLLSDKILRWATALLQGGEQNCRSRSAVKSSDNFLCRRSGFVSGVSGQTMLRRPLRWV
jgi:uncharacterized protein YigA (DUF484 family)